MGAAFRSPSLDGLRQPLQSLLASTPTCFHSNQVNAIHSLSHMLMGVILQPLLHQLPLLQQSFLGHRLPGAEILRE